MAGKGKRQIVCENAAAVIDHTDEFRASLFDIDLDSGRTGVDGILQEFLDDAGRPFDDLAGSDFGDDRGRKLADAWHSRTGSMDPYGGQFLSLSIHQSSNSRARATPRPPSSPTF